MFGWSSSSFPTPRRFFQEEHFAVTEFTEQDYACMKLALRLARRGSGRVSPNPMVGAVLENRGSIVGQGWHRYFGGPHAEVEAIGKAGTKSRGATLYVTLEPCAHHGKTPPCTDAILASGVARVIAAMPDPNPTVKGGGLGILAAHGVSVSQGLLEMEARELNRGFVVWAETGRPSVTVKLAISLDGRIACRSGDSKWITGSAARRKAHVLRSRHDAVVVGAGTVVADDPELNVRLVRGPNPARIVLDTCLSGFPHARWLANDGARRIAATTRAASVQQRRAFAEAGAELWLLRRARRGGVDLAAFLDRAAAEGFRSLMVEGGGRVASSFLASGLANRIEFFFAPVLLGSEGRDFTQGFQIDRVALAPHLRNVRMKRLGDDWQVSAEI
jgi:diaminohydroxyphosphoribosylaminopyrimidine deaminase / 5-amino-6-(5-phosphoribosylamino)uracil reductase